MTSAAFGTIIEKQQKTQKEKNQKKK